MPKQGFTLAELLISVTILGVIATFVIPKVLQTSSNSKKHAVFKEIISAYTQANYSAYLLNTFTLGGGSCAADRYDLTPLQTELINYLELCAAAEAGGCYTEVVNACAGGAGHRFVNGASSCGLGVCTGSAVPQDTIFVDWNGPNNGPNTIGEDQIRLLLCFGDGCNSGIRPGDTKPTGAESITLYDDIFSY